MNTNFWLKYIIIPDTMGVLQGYVASTQLTDVQKTAAEKVILDTQALLETL